MPPSASGPIITTTPTKPMMSAGDAAGGHALVAGEVVGDDDGEERRGGVEDRGEPAGDVALRPGDQAEGNDVVEEAHDEDSRATRRASRGMRGAGRAHDEHRAGRRRRHPEGDDGERPAAP